MGTDIAAGDERPPASTILHGWIAEQVVEVCRVDPLVRSQQPDAVHEMRVAVRRLRSALATYRPLFERETTEHLRDELRWLGRQLAGARDSEVVHTRLLEAVSKGERELVRGPVLYRVDRELSDRAERAHAMVVAAMDSDRYAGLLGQLRALAADPPFSDRALRPVDEMLLPRVRREWKRVKRRVSVVAEASEPEERSVALHETRKASKRLRYAIEPLSDVYGKPARRLSKAVKRVQSSLGRYQDSTVARDFLAEEAARAALDGEDTFTYGVLYAREEAVAAEAENAFHQAWDRASRKKLRAWFP